MLTESLSHWLILLGGSFFTGLILLGLFRLRFIMGKAPFYASLGIFRYLHYLLSNAFFMELTPGVPVSLGSSVLMMGILFAVLLTYLIEDALAARKVVGAMIVANLVFALLQYCVGWLIDAQLITEKFQFPSAFFRVTPLFFTLGLAILLLDGVLIIYVYEKLRGLKNKLFVRILLTLTIVTLFNFLIFSMSALGHRGSWNQLLLTQALPKLVPLLVYSLLTWLYMVTVEKEHIHLENRRPFKDVLFFMTYRKKYQHFFEDKKQAIKAKEESEVKFKTAFKTSPDSININRLSDGLYVEINDGFTQITGYTEKDVRRKTSKEINIWADFSDRDKLVTALREKGKVSNMEFRLVTKKGEILVGLMSANIIQINGEPHILSITRNITDRKKTEEKVKEIGIKLSEAASLTKMGYWELDILNNKLVWSDEVYRIFGVEPQSFESTYEAFLSYVHPDDREAVDKAYSNSLITREPYDIVHRVLPASGDIKYVREKCHTDFNEKGEPLRSIGAVLDITDQVLAEQEIAASKAYFQTIFNATTDAIFIHDAETGKIIDVNQTMVEMYGYDNKEEVLAPIFMESGSGESPYSPKEAMALFQKAKAEGPQTVEWLANRKNGVRFWTEVSIRYAQIANQNRFVVSVRNIQDRKKAEEELIQSNERYRSLFNGSPIPLWEEDYSAVALYFDELKSRGISDLNSWLEEHPGELAKLSSMVKVVEVNQATLKLHQAENKNDLLGHLDKIFTDRSWLTYKEEMVALFDGQTEFEMEGEVKTLHGEKREIFLSFKVYTAFSDWSRVLLATLDITRQKEMDQLLRDSEQKYRNIVESTTDIIFQIDRKGKFLFASEHAYEILGYTEEEAIGKSFKKFVPLKEIPKYLSALAKVLAGKEIRNFTSYVYHKDGHVIPIEITGKLVVIDGEKVGQGSVRDISERLKNEQILRESEEKFQTAFHTNPDAMVISRLSDGVHIDVNEGFVKMTGYKKKEFLGKSFNDISLWEDVKDHDRLLDLLNKEGVVRNMEARFVRKDGSVFDGLISDTVFMLQGIPHTLTVVRDITERKQAEKALRESNAFSEALLNTSPDLIYIYDIADRKNVYSNLRVSKILGYSQEEVKQMGDHLLSDLMHPDDFKKYLNTIYPRYQTAKDGEQIYNEYRMRHKDGDWRWLNSREIVFNRLDDGSPWQILGISSDITERKQTEVALKESETRYRYFVEQTGEGFYRFDALKPIPVNLPVSDQIQLMYKQMVIAECNDGFAQMYGYSTAEEVIGLPFIHFHQAEDEPENLNSLSRFIASSYKVLDAETKELDKKGNVHYFLNNAVGIVQDEKLIAFWGTQRDVTERKLAGQQIRQANARLKMLHDLDQAILKTLSVETIAQATLTWLNRLSGAARTSIALFDENNNKATVYAGGMLQEEIGHAHQVVLDTSFSDVEAMKKGELVKTPDFSKVTDLVPLLQRFKKEGLFSSVNIPVLAHGILLGSLNFAYKVPEGYTDEELELGKEVADSLAIAIEQANLHANLKQHAEALEKSVMELTFINNLSNKLNKTVSLNDLASKVVNDISDALHADVTLFYVLRGDTLDLEAYRDKTSKFELKGERHHVAGECLCGKAASTGQNIFSEDINKDVRCTLNNCKNMGLRSFAGLPLKVENKILGVIGLGYYAPTKFHNKPLMETLMFETSAHLQSVLLLEDLKKHERDLEEKVTERTAQLEHSNNELRSFAQVVSHDLKAPLRAISQLSFWLSQDYAHKVDEQGQENFKMLIGRVQRLDNLIDGILQYSRAGKVREKEKIIDLQQLVSETIRLLNVPENIEIMVENKLPKFKGDPTRLGQLFQNLIDNAIKYMDKPKGVIKLGYTQKEGFYEFYVSDNGPGIEEKYYQRIFQIFQRLVSRDEMEGTGIGLSLVKRIVQIYGGDIWLQSKVGEGTTFYFTLAIGK